MKTYFLPCFLLALLMLHGCNIKKDAETQVPRIIVLTDINNAGGDPDDKQSMGHLFMYANEVDIKVIVPDYWMGNGIEATLEAVDAYELDFKNPDYAFQDLGYPDPESLRTVIAQNNEDAIERIVNEAKRIDERPLYILVWGNMGTIQQALFEAPEIADKLRVLTIATNLMMDNPDSRENARVEKYCETSNWNGKKRNEIFNDSRFHSLWWMENDWAYNGMFEGEEPREFLLEIKEYGHLGHYIWEVVQSKSWAHYFRAGDTPTLLYLLEEMNHDDPSQFTWGGKFIRPFPETRPNYWIDDAGIKEWNYADPCDTWDLAFQVYQNRLRSLLDHRPSMYDAYRKKMEMLYSN